MKYAYTQEQIQGISIMLNNLIIKGRDSAVALSEAFKILEQGEIVHTDNQKENKPSKQNK